MIRRIFALCATFAIVALPVAWYLTIPGTHDDDEIAGLTGDAAAGEHVFYAAGCASCHAAPEAEDKLVLAGGLAFASDFGTFFAPNISQSEAAGIGDWSLAQFADAVRYGTSPDGQHYYPAFPYTTYTRMTLQDTADLYAFMQTLPSAETASKPHDVGFPFNIRRSLGGWKMLFMSDDWVLTGPLTEQEERGRYLVEALGHCAECHTPRNALGGAELSAWLGGGPNPDGKGSIPNITPHETGLTWSAADVEAYLNSGFTPEYDVAGGSMADVIENTKKLPPDDHKAIVAYLKKVPPVATETP